MGKSDYQLEHHQNMDGEWVKVFFIQWLYIYPESMQNQTPLLQCYGEPVRVFSPPLICILIVALANLQPIIATLGSLFISQIALYIMYQSFQVQKADKRQQYLLHGMLTCMWKEEVDIFPWQRVCFCITIWATLAKI